jgi:hypothetical protein
MALKRTSSRPWQGGRDVLLTWSLWPRVMSAAMAGTVHGTTREDPQFKRLVTTCNGGSVAMTREDEPFAC